MTLVEEINEKRKEIRTDGYPMSIGEWISLYENKEVDIHPEFQRFFRWTPQQKSNLIESLLLGIPLPPVFVSQREDGVWDVVDGLQRLSTIFEFIGILKDERGEVLQPLKLLSTKYLPSLQDVKWQVPDEAEDKKSFDQDLRLIIKRTKISVSIILKESDANAKYDLFQRLNTGGSQLSPQEVRNCILVMINKDFFLWLQGISKHPSFQETIALSERPLMEAYDVELILRFLLFTRINENHFTNIGDLGVFLTDKMTEIAQDPAFNKAEWEQLFKQTFDVIAEAIEDKAFKRYSATKDKFLGGFIVSAFETIACGIAYNLAEGTLSDNLVQKIKDMWKNEEYTTWSGTGITATRRLPHLIPFGRTFFSND